MMQTAKRLAQAPSNSVPGQHSKHRRVCILCVMSVLLLVWIGLLAYLAMTG